MAKYTISTIDANDVTTEVATRSDKTAAIQLAEATYAESGNTLTVQVTTEAGTVVHSVPPVEVEVEVEAPVSNRSKPWSRTEVPTFEYPVKDGYEVAYTRSRVKTVIYRALDKSHWLILNIPSGEERTFENTATGRAWTNELESAYKAERAKARDEAKAERAKLQAEKKTARDAAKAEAAQAKLAKAEAKAEAKAAKEAAKVADQAVETESDKELETASA